MYILLLSLNCLWLLWIFITVQLHCTLQCMIEGRSVVNIMFTIYQVPLVTSSSTLVHTLKETQIPAVLCFESKYAVLLKRMFIY